MINCSIFMGFNQSYVEMSSEADGAMGSLITTASNEKLITDECTPEQVPSSLTTTTSNVFGSNVVFLPLTYALNGKHDKHVTVGLIGDLANGVGLSFTGVRKQVFLSYHTWNLLRIHFDYIRLALAKRERVSFILKDITDCPPTVIAVKVCFGKLYVQIRDVYNNLLSVSHDEWDAFEAYLPSISRYILQLWRDENEIVDSINIHLNETPDLRVPSSSAWWCDRLQDEVYAYKGVTSSKLHTVNE